MVENKVDCILSGLKKISEYRMQKSGFWIEQEQDGSLLYTGPVFEWSVFIHSYAMYYKPTILVPTCTIFDFLCFLILKG